MSNPFQNIKAAAGDQDRSFNWYMNSVKKMAGELTDYNDVKKTDLGDLTSKIEPGNMYMFMYDPKLKETLPYYDTFPLCLPFDSAPGGFIGLNLHYLPPLQRAVLLGNLLDYLLGSGMTYVLDKGQKLFITKRKGNIHWNVRVA